MISLEAWQRHPHFSRWILGGGVLFLLLSTVAQLFVSPLLILAAGLGLTLTITAFIRPLWIVSLIAVYLPFESFILKFVPDEIYLYARYGSELLIYLLVAVIVWRYLKGEIKPRISPLHWPFALFVGVLLLSSLMNLVSPTVAVLGMRQILRFILVFFVVYYLQPSKQYITRLTWVIFGIVVIQSMIGIAQSLVGGSLDALLLPGERKTLGSVTLTEGVDQFWDPGSRVFATFGRYDRLGNFLYFFLLIAAAWWYEAKRRVYKKEMLLLLAVGLPTLILTFSRSSWFAFLFGFLFIGLYIKRSKRILAAALIFAAIAVGYVGLTGLNVGYLAEGSGQTTIERFYESFSYTRWRGEYYGLGRLYWMVQTPLTVVPSSPLLGHGPGQFGAGAAAALGNSKVYDELGLPFGVFGSTGFIDNNWFSLWGETGTIGFGIYLWMFTALFLYSIRLYRNSKDPATRAIALGFAAALIGVTFNAFLSTLLEIRTVAFYLWLYGAFVVVLGEGP